MTLTRAGDPAGDPGLFGPGSVTWQAHGDPMMWIAGIRALYLQALHPRAVRGVMQNSDFRRDAWGRLMRTAGFVGTTTYGTTEDAERAGARVRRIHRMLGATDPDTGERYGVDEPALLLWVHCAEIGSYLHVLRRSGFPLTDAHADRYLAEHRHSARLVGLDPATVPADRAALAAYFARVRPELAAGDDAHEVDDFLRRPPVHPSWSPHARCCGTGWHNWRTTPYRRTRTSSTADRPPIPPPSPVGCAPPAPSCARSPHVCAGNCRPNTSCAPWHGSGRPRARHRTNSDHRPPYWTRQGGRSGQDTELRGRAY